MNATINDDLTRAREAGVIVPITTPIALPGNLLPVVPFPVNALPAAFRPWVEDSAERMQIPPDFVALPLLIAGASLVGRHVAIRPKAHDDWTETANLWGLQVGRPGMLKSPAMKVGLAPIERLEARAAQAYNDDLDRVEADSIVVKMRVEAQIKRAKKELEKDPSADLSGLRVEPDEKPVRPRYVFADATYEAAQVLLADNPGGVLMVRDEARSMLMHLSREEQAMARGFFVQAWSGGSYTVERIGRGAVRVDDARLSIIGGIQPGPLADFMARARQGGDDDGLIQRFLIAWPDSQGKWRNVDRLPNSSAKRSVFDAFDRLDKLAAVAIGAVHDIGHDDVIVGLPYLRFDPDALVRFEQWHAELESMLGQGTDSDALESALAKFRHHVPALALVLHVIDGGVGAVDVAATTRALALSEYFESHARRLYDSARRAGLQAAKAILVKIRAGALPEAFTARDVYVKGWAGLERKVVHEALDMLAAHRWLTEMAIDTGGRPTVVYTLVPEARHG